MLRGRSRIRGEPQNRILLLYFDSFLSPNGKRSRLTACLELSLVSLTLQRVLCFETFEKKYWQIRCIGLPRIINLVCLERRNYDCFTWNLVQNLMKLVSISRTIRMWPKMTKTKNSSKKHICIFLRLRINSLNAKVTIILKLVNWFAPQKDGKKSRTNAFLGESFILLTITARTVL